MGMSYSDKLQFVDIIRTIPAVYGKKDSLHCSQEATSSSHFTPKEFISYLPTQYFKDPFYCYPPCVTYTTWPY
jgi:hypothetical protein